MTEKELIKTLDVLWNYFQDRLDEQPFDIDKYGAMTATKQVNGIVRLSRYTPSLEQKLRDKVWAARKQLLSHTLVPRVPKPSYRSPEAHRNSFPERRPVLKGKKKS